MKVLLLLICLAACVPVCVSQSSKTAQPDLTGTWQVQAPRYKGEELPDSTPAQIKITYRDPELIIQRRVQFEGAPKELGLTYYTDGRGETNASMASLTTFESWSPAETESRTIWSKDTIVTRSVEQSFAGAAILIFEIVDEWKLSSDGKTLTQATRRTPKKDVQGNAAFGNEFEFKTVYKLISR